MLRDLRAQIGQRVTLFASDGFSPPAPLEDAGEAAEGLLVSVAGVPPDALKGAARRTVSRLQEAFGEPPDLFSIYAAQATQLMLDAIGRSDGTRRSVIRELFASEVRHGILGDFDVTEDGDTTANQVAIYRVDSGHLRLDRVINPPFSLVVNR